MFILLADVALAALLGCAAFRWKRRPPMVWVAIGLFLPVVGFLLLAACPKENVE